MQLSPEERHKIYEEEKARIEAQQKQWMATGGSTTGLEPNIAGLLCYLGGWITGIVFLVIEQKNKSVRFHALQSIVTFGALTVASALLNWIPFVGGFFSAVIGISAFILWILLMVKAYQGELYKVPVAGHVAEGILPVTWRGEKPETGEEQKTAESTSPDEVPKPPETPETPSPAISEKMEKFRIAFRKAFGLSEDHYDVEQVLGVGNSVFWRVYWDKKGFELNLLEKCENKLSKVAEGSGTRVVILEMAIIPRSLYYINQSVEANRKTNLR